MKSRHLMPIVLLICCFGCKETPLPKPKAMLRLEFPEAHFERYGSDCPFDFDKNRAAGLTQEENCAMVLDYPQMKGSIYVTYKPVTGNLDKLLTDAQKLSYEHVVKADNIIEQPFINDEGQVYGMFYEVSGNAASQSQFYVTDSVSHFVTGSLYFYAKPNYDSVYPAAIYLQRDIRRIMESLQWQAND
ncbi:gliding motility lipoprotein GldD [Flagellimonas sp. DF-77]|uniref:gliding motility lipoprotein GldD n=1 Tax=Flagellimonas algarum TaxID=3230298 RepID=UPI00339290F2